MRFYTKMHKFYCGIDLHARSMYLCILDQEGNTLVHRNMPTHGDRFLKIIIPYYCVAICCYRPMSIPPRCGPHGI